MIKLTDKDKTLVIPSGLGNFGQSSEGGGVTPAEVEQIASAVTAEALDEYDTELQVELEDIRDAVSGNTDAISALSGATSGMSADIADLSGETETQAAAISNLEDYTQNELAPAIGGIAEGLEALSGVTSGMSADIASVSGQTSANTENIASLSAATEAISESLANYATTAYTNELATAISGVSESLANYATTATTDALSAVTSALTENVEALSAVTSALTENLETLSGGTPTIYSAGTAYTWCVIYDYDTINSLSNAQKSEVFSEIKSYGGQGKFTYIRKLGANGRNQFFPQSQLTATKAEYFSLGGANYDYVSLTSAGALSNGYTAIYTLPTAAANKKGGVKVGSGLTMNGEVMSVNIGEGLAFSGTTIVATGGGGGGIEKVDTLPLTATEGDIVWLNGHTETGYTFTYADYPDYESGCVMGYVDDSEVWYDGYGQNFGVWKYGKRFRRDESNLYADYLGGSNAVTQDAGSVAENTFTFLGKYYGYTGGKWHRLDVDYLIDVDNEPEKAAAAFIEIMSGLTDFDGSNLVIKHYEDYNYDPFPRLWRPFQNMSYGIDAQSTDDRATPARDGNFGRQYVDVNRLSMSDWSDASTISFNSLAGRLESAALGDIPETISQPGFTRFGNDERGYLYYDADNDRFQYDSGYIATGDTTTVYPDVIDTRFTDALIDGGLIDGYIYPVNLNKLYVIENGETKEYCHPILSRKEINETVDSVYFSTEITYDYGDWKLTAYYGGVPEGGEERSNNAANLRITTPYIV